MSTLDSQTGPFAMVPRWVIRHPDLKPSAVLVYAYLADRANRGDGNVAWPGQRTIADDLHLSKTTVVDAVDALEQVGALRVGRHHRQVNRYTVMVTDPSLGSKIGPVGSKNWTQGGPKIEPQQEPRTRTSEQDVLPTVVGDMTRDDLWDAVVDVLGPPSETQRKLQGAVVAELAAGGVTVDEVARICRRIATAWGPTKLTLGSLRKHWTRFRDDNPLAHVSDVDRDRFVVDESRQARRRRLKALEGGDAR